MPKPRRRLKTAVRKIVQTAASKQALAAQEAHEVLMARKRSRRAQGIDPEHHTEDHDDDGGDQDEGDEDEHEDEEDQDTHKQSEGAVTEGDLGDLDEDPDANHLHPTPESWFDETGEDLINLKRGQGYFDMDEIDRRPYDPVPKWSFYVFGDFRGEDAFEDLLAIANGPMRDLRNERYGPRTVVRASGGVLVSLLVGDDYDRVLRDGAVSFYGLNRVPAWIVPMAPPITSLYRMVNETRKQRPVPVEEVGGLLKDHYWPDGANQDRNLATGKLIASGYAEWL